MKRAGRRIVIALIISLGIVLGASYLVYPKKEEKLTVHEEEVIIPGLSEEFEMIFFADTHVSLCDERDETLMEKADSRYLGFQNEDGMGADKSFLDIMDYVKKERPDLLVLGGDVIDSAMWASIDLVENALKDTKVPWIYEMGNHDFEYGTEYFSDKAFEEYLPRLSELSESVNGCQIVSYEDFTILAVDDRNNKVTKEALETLKKLCMEDKPVILVMHVPIEPLIDEELLEETKKVWGPSEKGNSKVLIGENSCVPNKITRKFLKLALSDESPVVLVLSGHIHFYHKDMLTKDIVQIVTGPGYQREVVKIKMKPQ